MFPPATPSSANMQAIAQRCLDDCDLIAKQSEWEGAILRQFLSLPMKAVHELAGGWMRDLGMTVRVDDAGNLVGRRPASTDATNASISTQSTKTPALLVGSHLDTVPNAGRYDGILGFAMGIGLVRSLGSRPLPFHIDVVGLSEEEGVRFSKPYLGSHALIGTFDLDWLQRRDASGFSMASVIEGFGLLPIRIPAAAYEPSDVLAFIEPHIEQGTVLQKSGHAVGVVEAIAGQTRCLVQFVGVAGHAGTTPMMPRQDALVAAAGWITEVSAIACSVAGCRATVGYAKVSPNVRNVIPDRVTLSLDLRHIQDDTRQATLTRILNCGSQIAREHQIEFIQLEEQQEPAAPMDASMTERLLTAMSESGLPANKLISGAGHDAGILSTAVPSAMLFIRQPKGISHHPDEDVVVDDVAAGLEVLHQFTLGIEKTWP